MKKFLILSVLLLSLVGCEKDNPVTPSIPESPVTPVGPNTPVNPNTPNIPGGSNTTPTVYTFSIDKTQINAKSDATEETIAVATNGDWKASCTESWAVVTPSSGTKDNATAKVSITENISIEPRTCELTFTCVPLDSTVVVKISQEAKSYTFAIDKKSINATSEGLLEQITLTTNDEWTTTSSDDWVTISAVSGNGDAKIDVTLAENTTPDTRTATVILSGKNCGISVTITVEQQGSRPLKGMENGHEFVDLGLTSGTLWATCNVGASKPEDYGEYYMWAVTTPTTTTSSWDTYPYCKGGNYTHLTKYNFADKMTQVLPEDDVAHISWGGRWRMPTDAELRELIEECDVREVKDEGHKGLSFKSKTNDQSIFLPAAGAWTNGENPNEEYMGFYFSSSVEEDHPNEAKLLKFLHTPYMNNSSRDHASSIRAVFVY